MPTDIWNPGQYGRYADERARPFFDLTARLRAERPHTVIDLGCGTGDLTATLAHRWPDASITGLDGSPAMLSRARRHEIPGRLTFAEADAADWHPGEPPDVLVSNALFQWIPDHQAILTRLAGALAPGGELAFQVPGNFDAPSHTLLRELCRTPRWRDRLAGIPRDAPVADPATYLDLLTRTGCHVDTWETNYLHVLPGPDPVLDWVTGTALRPILAALRTDADREEFRTEYAAALRDAYPARPYGTVLPFRRIFTVARRPD